MERHIVTTIDKLDAKQEFLFERDGWLHPLSKSLIAKVFQNAATTEIWQLESDKSLDRSNGPAVIAYDAAGMRLLEEWRRGGEFHREDDGPAFTGFEDDFLVKSWFKNGKIHRDGAPAGLEIFLEGGAICRERWMQNGVLHRIDGPAYVSRNSQGVVGHERWAIEGKPHRVGAPAEIEYDTMTGVIVEESWYRLGELHREDGPAWLRRDWQTGEQIEQMHYLQGEQVLRSQLPSPSL